MTSSESSQIRFGLRNFKAFRYLEELELKPLTLLVGANSVGKSSILQSLLLLKQTTMRPPESGGLRFNGSLVKLGNFETVISDFDKEKRLEYNIEVVGNASCRLELSFGVDSKKHNSLDIHITEGPCELSIEMDEDVVVGITFVMAGQPIPVSGFEFADFWPEIIYLEHSGLKKIESLREWPGLKRIRTLIDRQLRYLGPVRADPRPFYPIGEEPILGTRGKGAIPYLLQKRDDRIRYSADPSGELREGPLLEAINVWLAHMEITTSLTIERVESVAYTAAMRAPSVSGRSVNLAQVGFGISQLLPVLILGLKNPPNGFLLFEQPEIHLHPRLQSGLGDFLLGVSHAGRTVMVETHSDHLINRIRRRIAEDTTGKLAEMVQILFVHPGTDDNPSSYVEPLSVDESGAIINCPPDFFSEASDEAFAILNARRKKRQTP